MPTARTGLSAVAVGGVIYAIGGQTSTLLATVEAYDPLSNTWSFRASMPTPRSSFGVAAINGIIYAVGGNVSTGNGASSAVEAYDPSTDTWTTKASMPTARAGLTAAAINGKIYAVGGVSSSFSSANEAYDPATVSWTAEAPMPTARQILASGVIDGILYAVGGQSSSTPDLTTNEAFTPGRNTITVNTISDSSASGDGLCSLREAINNANSPGVDTTGGDCAVGIGTDTITFVVSGTIALGSTLPAITNAPGNSLVVDGTGQSIVIDGGGAHQILVVSRGATLNLSLLTIAHGMSVGPGGGINNDGILTINNCTLSANSASSNSDASAPGEGGAIFNGGDGLLTINGSTLSGNQALSGNAGGAIYNNGSVTITNSTLAGNSSTSYGGAIFSTGGTQLSVSNSTIAGNIVPFQWGGINAPSATLTNTILAGNSHEQCGVGTLTNGGYNISDDGTCGFGSSTGASGQTLGDNVNPLLDPNGLQDNGGPTQTIALRAGQSCD